jgi:hypothetical protein
MQVLTLSRDVKSNQTYSLVGVCRLLSYLACAGCWHVQAANLLSYWHVQVVGVFEGSAMW